MNCKKNTEGVLIVYFSICRALWRFCFSIKKYEELKFDATVG